MGDGKMPNRIDGEQIKEVLKHYSELTDQIHRRIQQIKRQVDITNDQLIEVASMSSPGMEETGGRTNEHKDLGDVYLRYLKLVKAKEKDLADAMRTYVEQAENVERLYLCFHALGGKGYDILDQLYIQKRLYKAVEEESGLNHRTFEAYRRQAILTIMRLYESDLTNEQIKERIGKGAEMPEKTEPGKYEQITLTGYLKRKGGGKKEHDS